MVLFQVFKNLREDGKDCTSLYTDPHYFGRVWFNQMQKEFEANKRVSYRFHRFLFYSKFGGGGGGKALTMTMAPWNLPHGQWSKKLTMTMTPSILPMVNGQIDQF